MPENTELSIVVTPIMEIALAQHATGEQAALIAKELEPFVEQAKEWAGKAAAINVTSIDQKEDIDLAKQSRLAVKKIRTEAISRKKELKAGLLTYGRALDAVANHIEGITKPIEAKLQESEDFVKAHYAKIHADMVASRSAAIEALGGNPLHYNLGTLNDNEFSGVVEGLKVQLKAEQDRMKREQEEDAEVERKRKEAESLAETERLAKVEADRKERDRIEAENERLKKDREAQIAREAAERKEREANEQAAQDERDRIAAASEKERQEVEAERVMAEVDAQEERDAESEKQRLALAEVERKAKAESDKLKAAEQAETDRRNREAAEVESRNSATIADAALKISDLLAIRAGEWATANPSIKDGKRKFIAKVIKNLTPQS